MKKKCIFRLASKERAERKTSNHVVGKMTIFLGDPYANEPVRRNEMRHWLRPQIGDVTNLHVGAIIQWTAHLHTH